MRFILVSAILFITLCIITFLLWRQRTSCTSQVPAYIDGYWNARRDKRRSIRFRARLPVSCSVSERPGSIHHIFSKNISGEGICIQVPEILPDGSNLNLRVDLDRIGHINLSGEVVWVKESAEANISENRFFDTGIRFKEIDNNSKKKLKRFLHQALKEQKNSLKKEVRTDHE